jgi:hypothetical protein
MQDEDEEIAYGVGGGNEEWGDAVHVAAPVVQVRELSVCFRLGVSDRGTSLGELVPHTPA